MDNIPESTSSIAYSPGDSLSHTYVVKAVNSCGSVTAYGGAAAADGADVTPPARVGDTLQGTRGIVTANFTWPASPSPDVTSYKVYGAASLTGPFPKNSVIIDITCEATGGNGEWGGGRAYNGNGDIPVRLVQ